VLLKQVKREIVGERGVCMAIMQVVKYDGMRDVFAYKYPHDSLSTWSKVIVNETQEAILYKGGQALDWFWPGSHTLETANIPLLRSVANIPHGGKSPFSAEVWFVNKAHFLDIKWGTPTPIQIKDPEYGIFIPLRGFGQFGMKVSDSKKFLTTLNEYFTRKKM
jgi:membrane protease subunit (stomatin/prohibitin family)